MRFDLRLFTCLATMMLAAASHADKPVFGDTFMLSVGGMDHKAKATFQSTREGRTPFELDMNDLEMDNETRTVWLGATWQFADSWGISASYSNFDSKGLASASEEGNFGEIDWMVNAELVSDFDLDLYIIDLHWDFVNTGSSHLGVGVGFHVADMSAGISATVVADANGNPVPPVFLGAETAAVTAPLPNISFRGGHRFGDSWYLGATAGYFTLKVGDVDGELKSFRAGLEWRPGGGNVGLGLGYQYVDIDVNEKGSDNIEKFDMEFYGPILHVGVGF